MEMQYEKSAVHETTWRKARKSGQSKMPGWANPGPRREMASIGQRQEVRLDSQPLQIRPGICFRFMRIICSAHLVSTQGRWTEYDSGTRLKLRQYGPGHE